MSRSGPLYNGPYIQSCAFTPFTPGYSDATTQTVMLFILASTFKVTLSSATTGDSAADTIAHEVDSLNHQLGDLGISGNIAASDGGSGNIVFTSANNSFYLESYVYTAGSGAPLASGTGSFFGATPGSETVAPPSVSAGTRATGDVLSADNAKAAILSINTAMAALGSVQGVVGTGQNTLSYATYLAQSQISSFSAAESRIRDADICAEAANLTKAQILQQASIAAMAQANSIPQAVLSLLRG